MSGRGRGTILEGSVGRRNHWTTGRGGNSMWLRSGSMLYNQHFRFGSRVGLSQTIRIGFSLVGVYSVDYFASDMSAVSKSVCT